MQKINKAFTLVELIVVITILAILGTISFISLQGYSKKARDSRRTSDIANIKMSLEMFSLNTGYYPLPDNSEEVLYDNDLLWTQGIVGSNVITNLGRNLKKKPTDPLYDIEYIYSLASSKKEYEVMSVYEGGLTTNGLINSTYASDKYKIKVEGNYNELFVKTASHIFPVPSLITSATLPLDFDLVPNAIESQVITGGDNFPGLNIPNTETSTGGLKINLSVYVGSITKDSEDDDKKAVIEKIQLAYSGSDIETTGVYKTLLEKTTDDELLAFVDDVVLNKSSSSVVRDTDAPEGGDFSMDTETSSVDISLTITCPEEDQVEMYISGDIVNTPEWESCTSSKDIELSSGDGSKTISIKWRDIEENETIEVSKSISANYLLYTFTSHTFTNCEQTGSSGPSKSQCTNTYSDSWTNNSSYFNVVNGIQYWTVPKDGTYEVEVGGAAGERDSSSYIGHGGYAKGDLNLTKGQVIYISVGQQGSNKIGGFNGGGDASPYCQSYGCDGAGGGGTDVRVGGNSLSNRVIVAGGGGGQGGTGGYSTKTAGGDGGGLSGSDGGIWCTGTGLGASASAGGGVRVGCGGNSCTQSYGSFGIGGDGCGIYLSHTRRRGTGGGGGRYGGGGGGLGCGNGGGGGGSGYIGGVNNGTFGTSSNTGHGFVKITQI